MKLLKENYLLAILLALALLIRFLFLSYPAEVVFDEVHFGKFVSAYFTRQYYFDIPPPLGKLMIAGVAKIFGFTPENSFVSIGESASARDLLILRFLPALFGSLLPILIYLLTQLLGASKKAAFLAGFLILFDNAFLIESKFILVDSFLFCFSFLALLLYFSSRKQENRIFKHCLYFLAMAAAALAFSVKWTGLSFFGIIILFSFLNFLKKITFKRFLKFSAEMIISLCLFIFIYSLPFVLHFKLLSLSGPGNAFMSQDFQETLTKGKYLSFGSKFLELNQKMYSYNVNLTKGHADSSRWFQWPLGRKPVWYWEEKRQDQSANIYLVGNPLIWLPACLAVFWGIYRLFKTKHETYLILLIGYFVNLLPYILVVRAAFLYHYLSALGFAIMLLALWVGKAKQANYAFYLTSVLAAFLMIAPISYGLMVSSRLTNIYKALVLILH